MRRVGRSWYAFDRLGRVIGVYADMREMPAPEPAVTVYEPLRGFRFEDFEYDTRERAFTVNIEYEQEQDPLDVLRAKVQVLAERGATEGERAAARAALVRLAARG